MVSEVMLQVLAERNFISDADDLIPCCFRAICWKKISLMKQIQRSRFSWPGICNIACSLLGETSLEGA
jgi:hypothetical protein